MQYGPMDGWMDGQTHPLLSRGSRLATRIFEMTSQWNKDILTEGDQSNCHLCIGPSHDLQLPIRSFFEAVVKPPFWRIMLMMEREGEKR